MKLFGFKKKPQKVKFFITETDRDWVEHNFKWLIKVYGYPMRQDEQVLINESFFPQTFSSETLEIENIIIDLSELLNLESKKISFEIIEDLRDSYGIPLQTEGLQFDTELEICQNEYKIYIAKSITKRLNRLIYHIIQEFIKIKLTEDKLKFDNGDETSLFIYLAGIYFGFGVILSQNLIDSGRAVDGFWETKWINASQMPSEIMAYGLAIFSKIIQNDNPNWKIELPKELKLKFEEAIKYIDEFPHIISELAKLEALSLFNEADKEYKNQEYNKAISILQRILLLTIDDYLKSDTYNRIGYYLMRKGEINESINNFEKALVNDRNNGFANDNLGYALIRVGQFEAGRNYIDKAMLTGNNIPAYTYRNLAFYHFEKGDILEADENFKLAFSSATVPVDLLEFHYSDFLLSQNKKEESLKYLNIAVQKGEQEAIERKNEMKKN